MEEPHLEVLRVVYRQKDFSLLLQVLAPLPLLSLLTSLTRPAQSTPSPVHTHPDPESHPPRTSIPVPTLIRSVPEVRVRDGVGVSNVLVSGRSKTYRLPPLCRTESLQGPN